MFIDTFHANRQVAGAAGNYHFNRAWEERVARRNVAQ
jgi:hypothetical protein